MVAGLGGALKGILSGAKHLGKGDKTPDAPKPEAPKPPAKGAAPAARTQRIADCGEQLAAADLRAQGFDDVVAVKNNSNHGVDLIGRNSATGEVKVWEVKTTGTDQAPGLSKQQAEWGGDKYTRDRIGRAAAGRGNYGKVPEAIKNAEKVQDWIEDADGKVGYEKREVFIDDIDKGCAKHPNRPARSKPWDARQ
jgi:hypothetical protein